MSNIVLKGDVIQDLGEYLPNPYIERIEVTTAGANQVGIEIQYSLLFMISDEYDASDIIEQLNNINLFACFKSENTASPLSKNEVIVNITNNTDLDFYQLDSESIITKLLNGEYIDDLYDSEDRRVLKVSALTTTQFNTTQYNNTEVYCYVLSSLLNTDSLTTSTISKAYLNTSNIAYEKVFSPGLNVLREEEVIYLGTQGEKYGYTPLLALNRNYYKTQTISRETIISKVNSLIKRFKNRSVGPLADSVNSIKYVLGEEAETENLLVELDKVRRSFPNKTNNNPVGNLYAAYSKLLQNINSSFPPSDRLTKQKYLTGKVLDLRTGRILGYEPPPPTDAIEYIPEGMFLVHRERISTDETSDYAINKGIFFIRHEEILKRESHISKLINMDKLYEIVSNQDSDDLKRVLFSYFWIMTLSLNKSHNGDLVQSNIKTYGYNRLSRAEPPVENLDLFSNATRRIPQSGWAPIKTYFKEYNFRFQNPDEKLLCYEFQDIDSYSALYEANEIEVRGSMQFDYEIKALFVDSTNDFVSYLIEKFKQINSLLQDYKNTASEICSYNNIDNRFNDFFVNSIREKYPTGDYPWETAPAIYSIMIYLLTDQFDSFEDTIRYSKNVSSTISPENGNLDSLINFSTAMEELESEQILALGAAVPPGRQALGYTLNKEADLKALNYTQLLSEADAELVALTDSEFVRQALTANETIDGLYYIDEVVLESPFTSTISATNFYQSLVSELSSFISATFSDAATDTLRDYIADLEGPGGPQGDATYTLLRYYDLLAGNNESQAKLNFINDYATILDGFLGAVITVFRGKRNRMLTEKGFDHPFDSFDNEIDPVIQTAFDVFDRKWVALSDRVNEEVFPIRDGYSRTATSSIHERADASFERLRNVIRGYYRDNSNKLMKDINMLSIYLTVGNTNEIISEMLSLPVGVIPRQSSYIGPAPPDIANFEDISL